MHAGDKVRRTDEAAEQPMPVKVTLEQRNASSSENPAPVPVAARSSASSVTRRNGGKR